jgi:hypothetical protein
MTAFYKEFVTTAARVAYATTANEIGLEVLDLETGHAYKLMQEGAGASKMKRLVSSVSTLNTILLDLGDFREVTSGGDPGNVAAIGGHLASDTTPILLGDAAESWAISWATGNADICGLSIALPEGFDGSRDVTVECTGAGGTTNAPSFTVETSWDGGTIVADTAAGTAAAGSQNFSATVAAADVPDAPRRLSIFFTPGTHATDVFLLTAVRIRHYLT